jgi:hypothetical protein
LSRERKEIMSNETNLRTSVVGGVLAGVVLLVGLAPSTAAAQDMDARWLPWLGCWEAAEAEDDAPILCVRPAAEGTGAEFITWSGGEVSATETILADGVPRNAEREECTGIEEARFSDDGRRVYLKSDYVCEGGVQRSASGILAMVNPMEWVDIKAVDGSPWVLRYRLARASKVQEAGMENVVASRAGQVKAARIAASARLTEDDLIEAVGKVDAVAVEALVVERGDPFAVDAEMLIRMDDAGVPGSVIDLVVAVSHPDRFAVKAGPVPVEEIAEESGYGPRRHVYMGMGFYDPWYWGFGYGYYPYRYGYSPYYYGGFGYGWGYPYYRYSPVVVTPRSGGQMIKGRGYNPGGSGSGYTGRTGRSRGGFPSASGGIRSTSSPAAGSRGSSAGRSAKPRGGRSGTSGSSSGRTAKRRTGGGGLI